MQKERTVLLRSFYETKKNSKNAAFFYKEHKRTLQYFIKNVKKRRESNLLLQKNAKERRMLCSFEKNAYPTLHGMYILKRLIPYNWQQVRLRETCKQECFHFHIVNSETLKINNKDSIICICLPFTSKQNPPEENLK